MEIQNANEKNKAMKSFLRAMLITALAISLVIIGFVGAALLTGNEIM